MRTILITLCFAMIGCGNAFTMTPPANFVVLEQDDSEFEQALEDDDRHDERATNAHGTVIAVREVDNEVEGSLEFWGDAIKNRLRRAGGYELLEEKDVTAASGQRGKQYRFGHDEASDPYVYWVTLFVTDDRVFVIESGGRREHFESVREEIERSIAAFRID